MFQKSAFQNNTFQTPLISKEQLRDRPRVEPVYLVEITLKNSGPTLYFSDRNIVVGAQRYENYIEEIQGIGEEIKRIDSTFLNIDITIVFKNEKYKTYNYLVEIGDTYPFEGADCTIKEVYLDDNNNPSDPETLLKCNLDELQEIDLMSFQCKVSSRIFQKDANWKQEIIDTTVYPNAYEEVGKEEPIICGADILVPAIRIDWGARTTLKTAINDTQTTGIELSDSTRFPASGTIIIDEEQISYTSITSNVLSGTVTRAVGGTTATAHRAGALIWEKKTQYDSLLAGHELHAIGNIYADIGGNYWRVASGVSAIFESGKHKLRATSQITITAVQGDINVTDTIAVSDNISITVGGSHSNSIPTGSSNITNGGNVYDGNDDSYGSPNYGAQGNSQISFANLGLGTITTQYVWMLLSDGGTWDMDEGYSPAVVTPAAKGWFRFGKSGGAWDDAFNFKSGVTQGKVYECYKEVIYTADTSKTGSASKSGTVTGSGDFVDTYKVDRFLAVLSGAKDDDSGTITRTSGALIERCDHQFKYWLVNKFGFSLVNDIDAPSFNTAGSWYASNTYKFAFRIDSKIIPSEFLQRLAFECRSTIKEKAGKWYLDVLPDTAPAAIKTIAKSELAGEYAKFLFNKTKKIDIANDLTAKFKRDYAGMLHDSDWLGTSKTSDSTSQTKYGIYPLEIEFEYIRLQAMSDSVLVHIKLQRKNILLTTTFPVFWEHFSLKEGDTFDIDNDLYDARKFYIENFRRLDKGEAEIIAVEWW